MLACLRLAAVTLAMWPAMAYAQTVDFHVAYEDKDTPDHTGASTLVPENPGISVEMINLIQSRIPNLRITYSRKPWARCLAELEAGSVDAVFASSFKLERLKIGVYPMKNGKDDRNFRLTSKSYSLYKLKDSPLQWDGVNFSQVNQKIVALRGYAIIDDLKKMNVPVSEVDKSDGAFRMLLAGRIDGFAQFTEVGDYILREHPEFQRIVKLEPPLTTKDYYLQISHPFQIKNPELTLNIWRALAAIRQSDLERLTQKYMKIYSD